VAFVDPYADVRPSALHKPYSPSTATSNTPAAPAPSTRHTPRPAPQSELRAVLRSPAAAGLLASDAAVLAALWSHVDAHGLAWPSVSTLAKISHASTRTVLRSLKRLEGAGIVARHASALRARRRFRESNTYVVARAVALPQAPRAESPCPPRCVAPSPSPSSSRPAPAATPEAPAVEPVRAAPPSPSSSPRSPAAPHQVTPWRSKGPAQNQNQNARAGAQVREAPALPGDRLGPPAAAPSSPEVTPAPVEPRSPAAASSSPEALPSPRRTRAERAVANRAAWAARTRTSASATRATTPRRAPSYRARDEQAPDPRDALAALREWRESLPARGALEPASAPQAPAHSLPRSDRGPWRPHALGELLGAFAPGLVGQHGGPYARPTSASDRPAEQTRSDHRGARAPGHPRVEERAPPLRCPHSSG